MKKVILFALILDALFAITGCGSPSGGSPDDKPSYTVTFDPNGGSGTMQAQSIVSGTTAALTANAFTKAGVSFTGWATTTTGSVSYPDRASYTMGPANVTLYAIWTALPRYTVAFNSNGGSGTMTAQSILSGATVNLSPNTFTKTGSSFAGWATTSTGSIRYADRGSYTMETANTTLYAIWATGDGLAYSLINNDTEYKVACGTFAGTKLIIPEYYQGKKVTAIANNGFYQKIELTSISLPSTITSIGDYAFSGCNKLTGSLTIPSGVTTIGAYAFSDCTGLDGTLTIPSSVTSIGESAFSGCYFLKGTLTIPSGVTSIEKNTFSGCKGFSALTIPSGVTSIGDRAFYQCYGFTGSLDIPSGVTSIGERAFENCSNLNGTLTIRSSVKTIGESAFSMCKQLTGSLTIPFGVETIGICAFWGCEGMTGSLTIPSSVTSIGEAAFAQCKGFTGSLTIPSSITSIEPDTFDGCKGLNGTLTISPGVTSIGERAFNGCEGLTGKLTIPSGVTSIGDWAFLSCKGLTGDLTIPLGVISIGDDAFGYCSGMTGDLTIPSSVTSIGKYAFDKFSGVVTINAITPPTLIRPIFTIDQITAIKVPAASVDKYKWADYWETYRNIISSQ